MFWLLITVALVPLVSPQCLTPADDGVIANPTQTKLQLYQGQPHFSLSMLQKLSSLDPGSNLFFSPLSVYSTLLLAYFISSNQTEKSLQQILNLPPDASKSQVLAAYKVEQLLENMRMFNSTESFQLINANRLFLAKSLPIRKCMLELFKEDIEKLDFMKDVGAATDHINQWVADYTKGQIKDLIPAGRLSSSAKAVLANAAYFKGQWKSKFQPSNSKEKEKFFISSRNTTHVTMMKQKATFNHLVSKELGAHVLQLPYEGSAVSMFVFLPTFNAAGAVTKMLNRITPEILHKILSEETMTLREVEVGLPRFSVERSLELVPLLSKMGVGDLFSASSDLSALTGGSDIHLDDAVHKAKVKVDEEGTTAAAATAFFTFRDSRPLDVTTFICNHPFMFLLYDASSQTIMFAGTFQSPPRSG